MSWGEECPQLTGDPPDTCHLCATPLPRCQDGSLWTGRRWCSQECRQAFVREHVWELARTAALERDGYRCCWCGWHRHDGDVLTPAQLTGWRRIPRPLRGIWPVVAGPGTCRIPLVAAGGWRRHLARLLRAEQGRTRTVDRSLEVNHRTPLEGSGYDAGCHHHLENLETLCHPCHVRETTRQRRGWPSWRVDPRRLVDSPAGGRQLSLAGVHPVIR